MFYGMVFPGIIASSSAGECGHEYPATVNRTDVCGLNGTMPCAKSSCEGVAVGAGIFGCLQHGVPMLFILLEGRLQPHVYGAWPAELAIVVTKVALHRSRQQVYAAGRLAGRPAGSQAGSHAAMQPGRQLARRCGDT